MDARKVFLLVVTLFFVTSLSMATNIPGGNYNASTAWPDGWTDGGNPYNINGDVNIIGGTLTIDEGVEVVFTGGYSLTVNGGATLNAAGEEGNRVIFTGSTETAGFWGSIILDGTPLSRATGDFDYCVFEYGGDGIVNDNVAGALVGHDNANLYVNNCDFHDIDGAALGTGHDGFFTVRVIARDNEIYRCSQGIHVMTPDDILSNEIIGNTILGITDPGANEFGGYGIVVESVSGANNADIYVENNLIANCDGGIYSYGFDGPCLNNTVADVDEIALKIVSQAPTIHNNIFYNYGINGIYTQVAVTANNCCVFSGAGIPYVGTVNTVSPVTQNPLLGLANASVDDPEDVYDYHLLFNSPCKDVGTNAIVGNDVNGTTTDIGAFGGSAVAADDFWLCIKGTLTDGQTFNNSYAADFHVVDDVLVSAGNDATILATAGDITVVFLEDVVWEVQGDLLVRAIATTGSDLFITALEEDEYYGGFEFNGSGTGEFEHVEFSYGQYGVTLYNTAEVEIEDVTMDHMHSYGLYSGSSGACDLTMVEFTNCGSGGLKVTNGEVNMYLCSVENSGLGLTMCSADASIDSCGFVSNDYYGLDLCNAAPVVTRSYFADNGYNGIRCSFDSNIVLGNGAYETYGNRLFENGDAGTSVASASEIYLYFSTPAIFKRYNDFVDNRVTGYNYYLLYTNNAGTLSGKGNFWGGASADYNDYFYPYGYIIDNADWSPTANRDLYTLTNFDYADLCVEDEEWEDAAGLYWRAFNEDGEAAALKRWIFCHRMLGTDPEDLLDDLDDLGEVEGMESTLFWNRILLQNRVEDFEASIDMLDDFIEDAETDLDETMGMLAQLETYYQMALANYGGRETLSLGTHVNRDLRPLGLTQLGENSWVVPENFADYEAKRELLHQSVDNPSLRIDTGLPKEFILEAAYPNPFNPSVTIPFTLPHSANVKLAVFNMLGQRVETLVDRQLDAGRHSIVWNGNAHASGVYFVRLESPEAVQTQRLVLMK